MTTETGPRQTRTDQLCQALEGEIILGRLSPGTRLEETAIAKRYGVSRTPVREALRKLAVSGLIDVRPHQGAVVRQFSIEELIQIFEVMAELEGLCARLAARRIAPEERTALERHHEDCRALAETGDADAFYDANIRFHETIYQATRNDYLIEQTRATRTRIGPYRRYITYQSGRMRASIAEHAGIMEAIFAGDGEIAHRRNREHVMLLGDDFADFISFVSGGSARNAG